MTHQGISIGWLLQGYLTYITIVSWIQTDASETNKKGRCICRFQWQMLRSSEWILTHKNYYIGATPFPTFSTFQVTNQFSLFFSSLPFGSLRIWIYMPYHITLHHHHHCVFPLSIRSHFIKFHSINSLHSASCY